MKTLMYFFVMAVIVIAGCAKDDTMFETQDNLELKKAKVPVPFKADCFAVFDVEIYWKLWVSGTATHIGKIDEKSFYIIEATEYMEGVPYHINTGSGKLVAANGDCSDITFWVKQSDIDGSYTGTITFTPGTGTGKLEGVTGTCNMVGGMDYEKGGTWFKLDGFLVYE
ncbi:MAG: hypothetical protein K0B11_16765 [Mariniphaga sp.]|nr:hypothetical protein [Mariniphaga sp.]